MLKKCFYIFVFVLLTVGCKDRYISPIPDYPVNLQLNLLGEYNTFYNSHGQQLVFTEPQKATDRLGYGGILVCTNFAGEYCAFDLACPYEAKSNVRVHPDGLFAVCDSCGSKFDIWETNQGVQAGGPSKYPLKKYQTMLNSNGILLIFR